MVDKNKRVNKVTEDEEYLKRKRRIEERNRNLKRNSRESNYKEEENLGLRRAEYRKKERINLNIPFKKIGKWFLGIISVLLIGIVLFLGFNIYGLTKGIHDEKMVKAKEVSMQDTVNILLLGLDVGDVKNPKKDNSDSRTDTIMVLNYNPLNKKINIVSIPRDTMVKEGNEIYKINSAYQKGGETKIKSEVEKLLGIDINYIAKINYKAFRDIIDKLGGVTVDIKHKMDYTDKSQNLRIKFNKGDNQHLNGKQAEEFFRWRKNNDGTGLAMGDLDRIDNQQILIKAVMKEVLKPSIVFKLPDIFDSVKENIKTNMQGDIALKYILKLTRVNIEDVHMTKINGTPKDINGLSYFVFEKDKNKELLTNLKLGTNKTHVDVSKKRLLILNGTDISGLAAKVKEDFKDDKFKEIDVLNSEQNDNKETYLITNDKAIEDVVSYKLPIKKVKSLKDSEYKDYDGVIVLGENAKK